MIHSSMQRVGPTRSDYRALPVSVRGMLGQYGARDNYAKDLPVGVVRTSVETERYGAASMYSQFRGNVFTPSRSYTCSAASTRAWLRIPSVMSGRSGMGGIAFST